jgi:DNA-binding response OmpR family regulator
MAYTFNKARRDSSRQIIDNLVYQTRKIFEKLANYDIIENVNQFGYRFNPKYLKHD